MKKEYIEPQFDIQLILLTEKLLSDSNGEYGMGEVGGYGEEFDW